MGRVIEIKKNMIPYRFEIVLCSELFSFLVDYNAVSDSFSVDLYKDQELIVSGEQLVYGSPLFADFSDTRLPSVDLIPCDEANNETVVTWSNLSESVFLFVVEKDGAL
ncbi:hypothetical protein E0485_15210 [Paenibacillus albiflavus]|uniref:Cyanophage baseplate Pam3 plug gp18 domain-containing protein n=1 Tax=Paenibacillus albiflavus TaxID=2545760 RepID=A0A4R4EAQ2_9BACL|nr:hypothetical protein [Paenibacillus albiflavus]TCZ76183.1 hypothetical protein E0485_15210 [Paenibacillus albiflavus]